MCEFVVNLKEILFNFNQAKAKLKQGVKICVVLKANAYGFGAGKICELLNLKADYFAVARLSEFLKIEKIAKKPVLILSPLEEKSLKVAIEKGAEVCISSLKELLLANKIAYRKNKIAKIHIAIDTGMNRFGFKTQKEVKEALKLLCKLKNIKVVGVFSHMFDAKNATETEIQRKKFLEFKKLFEKRKLAPLYHFSSSGGLKDCENQFDMVRLGFDLYNSKKNLHSLQTKVATIKEVSKGEHIGYANGFIASKDMKVAVCLAGYADGVPRMLSNSGDVLICGVRTRIVGNVCMDCFMCDISEIQNVKIGDSAVIFGAQKESSISVCEIATKCDTIAYEIYTGISERVKRVYRWR